MSGSSCRLQNLQICPDLRKHNLPDNLGKCATVNYFYCRNVSALKLQLPQKPELGCTPHTPFVEKALVARTIHRRGTSCWGGRARVAHAFLPLKLKVVLYLPNTLCSLTHIYTQRPKQGTLKGATWSCIHKLLPALNLLLFQGCHWFSYSAFSSLWVV